MKNPAISIDSLHDIDLKEGKFEKTTAADIRRAFANLKEHGPSQHLCVFFHGGLVSEADGLKTADELLRNYTSSGAYPFFIWHFRVDRDVTAPIPHRPGRAQLRHPVLHCTGSLTGGYSCAQSELVARETF